MSFDRSINTDTPGRPLPYFVAAVAAIALIAGCSNTQKMSDAQLESLGIRVGAAHWDITPRLFREGYVCFVNGAKRESFDCSKTTGLFPSCIMRIRFAVDDQNQISAVSVPEPACLGTP